MLVLIGEFLQQALRLRVGEHLDLLSHAAGIVLVAAALFLTGRASEGKTPPPDARGATPTAP